MRISDSILEFKKAIEKQSLKIIEIMEAKEKTNIDGSTYRWVDARIKDFVESIKTKINTEMMRRSINDKPEVNDYFFDIAIEMFFSSVTNKRLIPEINSSIEAFGLGQNHLIKEYTADGLMAYSVYLLRKAKTPAVVKKERPTSFGLQVTGYAKIIHKDDDKGKSGSWL